MDLLKTLGGLLTQVAPTIATALAGPLAGTAVKALSIALLGNESGTEQDVAAAIQSATPEQLANLKKIDADFQTKMAALDIDLEKISADDRKSARDMQVMTHDWVPRLIAILVTVGFFSILVYMMMFGMPKTGTEALLLMLGSLGTAWTGIINFYYGSTSTSKQRTLADIRKESAK